MADQVNSSFGTDALKNEDRAAVSWRVDVAERLKRPQSASTAPTDGRMTELENSLGVSRGRSVETSPVVRGMSRAAVARLLPDECRQLAKGAQENEPQHPDARFSYLFPIRQRLEPGRDPLLTRLLPVSGLLLWRDPDVDLLRCGILDGGPTPWLFGRVHSFIMSTQISVDKSYLP